MGKSILILLLIYAVAASNSAFGQTTAGQVLAKLQKLSPENRQKVLIEQAKNEK
jgi:hypothetical protein